MIRFIKPLLFVTLTFVLLLLTDMDERLQRQAEQNAMGKMQALISASKEIAAVRLVELNQELNLLSDRLHGASVNSSRESQIDNKVLAASDYEAVAIYKKSSDSGTSKSLSPIEIVKFKTKKSVWNQKWWQDRAKEFVDAGADDKKIEKTGLNWQRLTDGDGQVYFFTKQRGLDNEMRIGIVSTLAFGQFVRLIQENRIVTFLTNSVGVGFAHNDQNIVGASFKPHGLVTHQMSSQSDAAQGSFRDWDGAPNFGAYARVPGTNLFVAATILQSQVVSGLGLEVWIQWLIVAIGVAFFLAALISEEGQWLKIRLGDYLAARLSWFKNRKTTVNEKSNFGLSIRPHDVVQAIEQIEHTPITNQLMPNQLGAEVRHVASPAVAAPLAAPVVPEFKWDSEIAKALVVCLQQPVTAAVGLLQSGNYEFAEKELRRARQLIESLCAQMNANRNDEWADLTSVVESLEPRIKGQLDSSGVVFRSGLREPVLVRFDNNHLMVVISTVFQWLVDRAEEKQGLLAVDINPFHVASMGGFDLVVTGINLKHSDADQFFQPFQNRLTSSRFLGLEFLVIESLVKMAGGHVFVEKRKTDQIAFVLRLPSRIQSTKRAPMNPSIEVEL
jgi:hypothetical protein